MSAAHVHRPAKPTFMEDVRIQGNVSYALPVCTVSVRPSRLAGAMAVGVPAFVRRLSQCLHPTPSQSGFIYSPRTSRTFARIDVARGDGFSPRISFRVLYFGDGLRIGRIIS